MRSVLVWIVAFVAALVPSSSAEAQRSPYGIRRHVTVTAVAGVSQWDLGGTGNSPIVAVRADRTLGNPTLLGEVSLATFRPDEQGGRNTLLIPEIQLQLQVPRAIAPYAGVGLGSVVGSGESDFTASGAVGLRAWEVIPRAVLRAELRVRGIGTGFEASAAEWTAGIGWSF